MVLNAVSPIQTIDGVEIPISPSDYVYHLEDASASDAGRTEDVVMNKMRIGQVRAIDLTWNAVSTSVLHTILNLFNPEYITVQYLDPLLGKPSNNYFVTSEFYVGNRTAVMYNATLDVWENISFSIIQRAG